MKKFLNGFIQHFTIWMILALLCISFYGLVNLGYWLFIQSSITWWGSWAFVFFIIVVLSIMGGLAEGGK